MTLPTVENLATQMEREILMLVEQGMIPKTVGSFSELHDYIDANLLGGTEQLLAELDEDSITDADHVKALDALADLFNPASGIVDRWIKRGGVRQARVG